MSNGCWKYFQEEMSQRALQHLQRAESEWEMPRRGTVEVGKPVHVVVREKREDIVITVF